MAVLYIDHAISCAKFFSQKYGNAVNGIYVFESTWHVLVKVIIKWRYIYRSVHAFLHQFNHNGDTVAEMFRVKWHRFCVLMPVGFTAFPFVINKPQGLLWQLLRVCVSHLFCALCYIFILNGAIKQWNCFKICDSSLASYQWLLYICPHLIVTDTYIQVPWAFKCIFYISCIAILLAKKNSCHSYGMTVI